MIRESQAVQSLLTPNLLSSVQLSRTALLAAASPPAPSANLTLGISSPAALLYAASGFLTDSSLDAQGIPVPTVASATAETTSNTNLPPPGLAVTATIAAPAVITPPVVAAENPASTPDVTTPTPVSSTIDPEITAESDFTTNPVHGSVATALYLNAAIYRMNQVSSASLVGAVDLPGPVTSLTAINVDIADLGRQSAEGYR